MKKNNNEVKVKIPIPDFLPEGKREEFISLTEKLIDRNLLNEMDCQAYNLLWFYYLMCLEAMAKIKEIGLVQKDRHIVRKNPAIQILRDASSQFYKFAGQYGLMPVARRNSLYLDLEIPTYMEEDNISWMRRIIKRKVSPIIQNCTFVIVCLSKLDLYL